MNLEYAEQYTFYHKNVTGHIVSCFLEVLVVPPTDMQTATVGLGQARAYAAAQERNRGFS